MDNKRKLLLFTRQNGSAKLRIGSLIYADPQIPVASILNAYELQFLLHRTIGQQRYVNFPPTHNFRPPFLILSASGISSQVTQTCSLKLEFALVSLFRHISLDGGGEGK